MALSERESVELIADEHGHVTVKTRTDILKNGEVVGSTIHRRVIEAGADLKGEDARTVDIAKAARKHAKK